jgi:hypothetical protein
MRPKLLLAGIAAGVAASFLPLAPASAQCGPALTGDGGGCSNPCQSQADAWNGAQKAAFGEVKVDYWDLFACTQ